MKITKITGIMVKWPCEIMSDALSVCRVRQALLVKIETDKGIFGIGEAFCYGSPLKIGKKIIEDQLAPMLIGEDPTLIEELWNRMYWRTIANGRRGLVMGAISGIDIALWDILGKSLHMPIHQLLGTHSDKIPAYASGGFYAPGKGLDEFKQELETYRNKGYHSIKIKIGRNHDIRDNPLHYMDNQDFSVTYEEDIRRLEAAREILGSGRLFADLNAAWSTSQVLAAKKDFIRVGLDWLEEPTVFEDREGCRQIAAGLPEIRIIGYETEQGVKNFQHLLADGCVDIVQPDIGWCGGISESKKIAAVAMAYSRPVSMHSFGSAVHFAASLHLAASLANVEAIESEENRNALKTDIIRTPFNSDEDMNFYAPQGDGLGIDIDWDKIEELVCH